MNVDALIGEVRKVHRALVHEVIASAVLVHAGAGVEPGGRDVDHLAIGFATHQHAAPLFRRANLGAALSSPSIAIWPRPIDPRR